MSPPEARAARILSRLDTLFEIGRAEGTNRPGLGAGEQQAYEQVAAWMREAGLEVEFDAGGNLYGRLRGRQAGLPEVWSGSHLDTPPDGGRFDGALGVVAALDAAEAIGRDGGAERTLAVVAFRHRGGDHVLGAARPRRHGADGAALRRARGGGPVRGRRARQRTGNPGFSSPRDFLDTLTMGLDQLAREGGERCTMMTVAVHARWSGQAARAAVMRKFVEHAQATPGVRFMRRGDIARWWLDTYPPETGSNR